MQREFAAIGEFERNQACPLSTLNIAHEPIESLDAIRLMAALDAELANLYPDDELTGLGLDAADVSTGRGKFLVARDQGVAVACGAIRLLDSTTVEVKRMYVDPRYRGHRIGSALLEHLEAAARHMGAKRAVLDTGAHQVAAIALYRHAGYRKTDCWGRSASSGVSVCFEKGLT